MKVLIGCEESQTICKAFRVLGHEAFSNDLEDCSGGHPEWHLKMDVFDAIAIGGWDLAVFHPPCTFLAVSAVRWLSHPEDTKLSFEERRPHPWYPTRRQDMLNSVEFVKKLYNCNIPRVAIENPIGLLSSRWRKPDQIIQPYQFGEMATKATCLWLKNLPLLKPTNNVKEEMLKLPYGEYAKTHYMSPGKERSKLRSKTFQGIADAIADQWNF